MVNGNPIDIKNRPYQVAINVNYIPAIFEDCHCGGTIISANYILTAAHPFVNDEGFSYVVRGGTSDCTWWGTVYHIKENGIIVHASYELEPRLINDLAILETESEIRFTNEIPQPIVMADEDFNTSDLFVEVSGYGRICENRNECPNTKSLEMIELTTLSFDECSKHHPKLLPNMLCHVDKSERSTTCRGEPHFYTLCVFGGFVITQSGQFYHCYSGSCRNSVVPT